MSLGGPQRTEPDGNSNVLHGPLGVHGRIVREEALRPTPS